MRFGFWCLGPFYTKMWDLYSHIEDKRPHSMRQFLISSFKFYLIIELFNSIPSQA